MTTIAGRRPGSAGDVGRMVAAVAIIVGLSSGPFVALSRWVAKVPLGPETWPYRYTYWVASVLGAGWFVFDVVGRIVTRPFGSSKRLLLCLAAPVALAVWTLCSAWWTESPSRTISQALLMALVVLSAVWFGVALSVWQHVLVLFLALQSMTLASIPLAVGFTSGRFTDGTWIGMFNNPNTLSPVAGLGIVAAVGVVVLADHDGLRAVAGLLVVVDLVVMAKSSSATGWLALVASLAAVGLVALVRALQRRGASAARVRAISAGLVAVGALSLPWVFRAAAGALGKDSTLTGRTVIWDFVLDNMSGHWLTGYGYQSFWDDPAHREALGRLRDFSSVPDSAHSTFFEVLVFLGVVGVILLVVVVAISVGHTWWAALSVENWTMGWWVAIVTFVLFENLTESMITYHSIFWMLLVAAGFAALRDSVNRSHAGMF